MMIVRIGALLFLSYFIVAFGQPAHSTVLAICALCFGYALCLRALLLVQKRKRFWVAACWFSLVSATQMVWLLSHMYIYIYAVYLGFCALLGLQFGLFSLLITPKRMQRFTTVWIGAAVWTLFEWTRLFFLSGYTWNPVGLAATAHIVPLQMASLVGIYGLSFWVMFVNLAVLRAWLCPQPRSWVLAGAFALVPFFYGLVHLRYHAQQIEKSADHQLLRALLVQRHFPVGAKGELNSVRDKVDVAYDRWWTVLTLLKPHVKEEFDLIVLPEYVLSLSTYWPMYRFEMARALLQLVFDEPLEPYLPALHPPYAEKVEMPEGSEWFVTNAYFARTLANLFQAEVIIGLQDEEEDPEGVLRIYSAAQHFSPDAADCERCEKRILLPMGEYIPFQCFRDLAAKYGVAGSFTPGSEAKLFHCAKANIGISICYEETFGEIMRESRSKGAEVLINLTNDGWYPRSLLTQQHFDHGRVRSVELGVPALRAANTGISAGVDSLGRIVAMRTEEGPVVSAGPGTLCVTLPLYAYQTVYGYLGDSLAIGGSLLALCFLFSNGFLFALNKRTR